MPIDANLARTAEITLGQNRPIRNDAGKNGFTQPSDAHLTKNRLLDKLQRLTVCSIKRTDPLFPQKIHDILSVD